ncbi:unnamed protein product, partial [Allacma fusca]
AHLGLVIAGKAAIYIGLAMGFCQPPRVPSELAISLSCCLLQLSSFQLLASILWHIRL